MIQYLVKVTLTAQAWANLKEKPQNRFEVLSPLFENLGGKLLDYWFAIDQGAVYLRFEGSGDLIDFLTLEILSLSTGTATSFEATRLLTAAEAVESMKKAKRIEIHHD